MTSARKWPGPDYKPPSADQVEVNLFGPGVGECVLVHLGAGSWLVVDSCIGRGQREPAALEYLRAIGVDPALAITMIVATHWHDDHALGIAKVFDAAPSAKFYISGAVRPDEFAAATAGTPFGSRFTSGVDELAAVALIARGRNDVVYATHAGQRIRNQPGSAVTEIWALSPSSMDLAISRDHIASLVPQLRAGMRRAPSLEANDTSLALLLDTVAGGVLLGGDLEHPASRARGWHAIMDNGALPPTQASLFKVAHHGSKDAHCPEVWEHRLVEDALAVLAPYDRGNPSLPRNEDRRRIRGLTGNAFLTSDKRHRAVQRDRATERTIGEATRYFNAQTLRMGHVQARSGPSGWVVALSPEAVAV